MHDFSTCFKKYSALEEDIRAVLSTLIPTEREVQTTKDKWYLLRTLPYRTTENVIEGAVISFVDITEHKKGELVSARLAAIVQSSEDAIIGKDLDGVITAWNRGAEKIFGYTASEIVGTSILRLIPADRHQEEQVILEKIRGGDSVNPFETLRQTKDGRLLDVSLTASPIRDADGTVVGVSKVARDITSRKRAEAELRANEERFRIVAQTTNDLMYEFDMKNNVQWFGDIDTMLGYAPGEFPRTLDGWMAAVHPDDREAVTDAIQAHLETRSDYNIECRVIGKDGNVLWVSDRGLVTRTPEGVPLHWIGSITNITEKKRADRELREQNEELARFNRLISGRELHVIELKQQVNELAAKLGQPHPYPLAFLDAAASEFLQTSPKPADPQPEASGQKSAITNTQKE